MLEYNINQINEIKNALEINLKKLKNSIIQINKAIKLLEEYFINNKINNYELFLNQYHKKYQSIEECIKQIEEFHRVLEIKQIQLNELSKNTLNRFE